VVADRRDTTTRLATGDDVGERQGARIGIALLETVRQVLGEGGRPHEGVGEAGPEPEENPVGVARPHGHGAGADPAEHEVRVPGDEGPGAEGGEDRAVVVDPGRVIGAGADRGPGLDVGAGEGDHARRAGRAAGLVDALDQFGGNAQIAAEGGRIVDRLLQLVLGREGKPVEVGQARRARSGARLAEFPSVERRALEHLRELPVPGRRGQREGRFG